MLQPQYGFWVCFVISFISEENFFAWKITCVAMHLCGVLEQRYNYNKMTEARGFLLPGYEGTKVGIDIIY